MTRTETGMPALLANRADATPDGVALLAKVRGRWEAHSWADHQRAVAETALGLQELGLGAGEAVLIVGDNSVDWLVADLGAQAVGAFVVGVFATTPAAELAYLLTDCGARTIVVGDQEQADKVLESLALPEAAGAGVERIVYLAAKGMAAYDDERLIDLAQVRDRGRAQLEGDPGAYDTLLDERHGEETALVAYTSGTTGLPKGVMISQEALVDSTGSHAEAFPLTDRDRIVAWVSVAHMAVRGPQVYTSFRTGARLAFPESAEAFQSALFEIAPTYVLCPPRYLELVSADIRIRVSKSSPIKRLAYRVGTAAGRAAARRRRDRGRGDVVGRVLGAVGWVVVGKPVLEKLGLDKTRWALAGGAAVSAQLLHFFSALGLELRQVYGLAETGGLPFAQHGTGVVRPGTVGTALPGIEARIGDDGELLVRGAGLFSGYLGRPEETAAALDEDWFNTGDLAELTDDGELVLLDQESAVMRTASGTAVAPSEVENALKFSPYIAHAVVVADGRPFPVALIQIELDTVSDWAQRQSLPFTTFASLTELDEVRTLIGDEIAQTNDGFDNDRRVADFRLLPKELDVDDDELTPTGKVKRAVLDRRFADLIDDMYSTVSATDG